MIEDLLLGGGVVLYSAFLIALLVLAWEWAEDYWRAFLFKRSKK